MNEKTPDIASRIADELASCGVKLVASLPDNWLMNVIKSVDQDGRFIHVPVNREESAIGLCSGAYMGAMGSAALMGASGFMTVIYAITKINYTYEIPLFLMLLLFCRGYCLLYSRRASAYAGVLLNSRLLRDSQVSS